MKLLKTIGWIFGLIFFILVMTQPTFKTIVDWGKSDSGKEYMWFIDDSNYSTIYVYRCVDIPMVDKTLYVYDSQYTNEDEGGIGEKTVKEITSNLQ